MIDAAIPENTQDCMRELLQIIVDDLRVACFNIFRDPEVLSINFARYLWQKLLKNGLSCCLILWLYRLEPSFAFAKKIVDLHADKANISALSLSKPAKELIVKGLREFKDLDLDERLDVTVTDIPETYFRVCLKYSHNKPKTAND